MRFSNAIIGLVALTQSINAVAVPDAHVALDAREPEPKYDPTIEELWKRKGGGGGGGRGGGSSSSGGGKGGSSSSGSGSGKGGGLGSSSSNTGGRTTTGSGVRPGYGGGSYYGGGGTQPYRSGSPSFGGIVPFVLAGAALSALTFGGLALIAGSYAYPYHNQYTFHNATTDKNETKPVVCVCEPYNECGCDEPANQTAFFNDIIRDGSYSNLNHSLVTVAKNETTGNDTIYINGGLPNGTTAAGGTEDPNAAGSINALAQALGWWPLATTVLALAYM
ncbi:hypothetical protein GGR57DRAFT_387949 [Xylariaceae sp. FL1272]|nr:hypothetical protein GGR57DRAFT_387949 [Xylariaceae sp. FL1272]